MKALAIAMVSMMGLFVLTEPSKRLTTVILLTAKAAQRSKTRRLAKKTVASSELLKAGNEPQQFH